MLETSAQLKAARTLAGMTQEQLAEAAGVHRNAVVYWERAGAISPKSRVPVALVKALRGAGVIVCDGGAILGERLDVALADETPLTNEQRRARAGLTTRQVTLR